MAMMYQENLHQSQPRMYWQLICLHTPWGYKSFYALQRLYDTSHSASQRQCHKLAQLTYYIYILHIKLMFNQCERATLQSENSQMDKSKC